MLKSQVQTQMMRYTKDVPAGDAMDLFVQLRGEPALALLMHAKEGLNGQLPKTEWNNGGGTASREQAAENRAIVLEYVTAHPGCQAREISDFTGWSTYKISNYLSDLKTAGKVTNRFAGKDTRKWGPV